MSSMRERGHALNDVNHRSSDHGGASFRTSIMAISCGQIKAKEAREKAARDARFADLRGVSRLDEKEAIAARKRARDPRRRIAR